MIKLTKTVRPTSSGQSGSGYFQLSHRESLAEDVDLQVTTTISLLKKASTMLRLLREEYDKYEEAGRQLVKPVKLAKFANKYSQETEEDYIQFIMRNHRKSPLKGFDNILWRIEVDIENVEDLVEQFTNT